MYLRAAPEHGKRSGVELGEHADAEHARTWSPKNDSATGTRKPKTASKLLVVPSDVVVSGFVVDVHVGAVIVSVESISRFVVEAHDGIVSIVTGFVVEVVDAVFVRGVVVIRIVCRAHDVVVIVSGFGLGVGLLHIGLLHIGVKTHEQPQR
uniref:Uncharacterized protein n=1 Tax=Phaeomonas parva TaxID=124430 RepID=A0A7S1U007_9STRA